MPMDDGWYIWVEDDGGPRLFVVAEPDLDLAKVSVRKKLGDNRDIVTFSPMAGASLDNLRISPGSVKEFASL